MKRLVLLLLCLLSTAGYAATPKDLWEQGVQAADLGDYRKALDRFQAIRQEKLTGPSLDYNLAVCYQHLGDKGRARACYETARRLSPWDRDVNLNLAHLRESLDDNEPEPSALAALAEQFPTTPLALCFTALQLGFWGCWWLYLRTRRELHFWVTLGFLGLWLGSGLLLYTKLSESAGAAVLPQAVQLKNGPGREYTDSVTVHAGTLVQPLSRQGDWTEVEALGRIRAWIREDDLAEVGP